MTTIDHVMKLGVDIATGHPTGIWQLGTAGYSELGATTYLAASTAPPGLWEPMDCDLIEASWSQGTTSSPGRVVPRPDPGTCTLIIADRGLTYLPRSAVTSGLRPGRLIRIVDRSDGLVLWTGAVESASWDLGHADPLHHLTITGVDGLSRLGRAGQLAAGERGAETAAARANYLMGAYAPDQPKLIDPGATHKVADTIEQSVWDGLVDAADAEVAWLWVRRDGLLEMGTEAGLVNPGASWLLDDCDLPISYPSMAWDQMGWATRWTVTRRHPAGEAAVPQTVIRADVEDIYGRWQDSPLDSYPVPTDADALRVAETAARWRGWPRLSAASLAVNVTAGRHISGLSTLLGLVRTLQLGDTVDAPAAGLPFSYPLLAIGWNWIWSGAGTLEGTIQLDLRPSDALAADYWQLGLIDASKLDLTTTLAPEATEVL